MRIYDLRVHEDNENIKLSVSIDSYEIGKQSLWFSTKNKYAKGVCKTRFDAFLVGMLFPAMKYGEDILVEGCVSSKLIFNINNYVIPLISSFSPSCKRIQVTAGQISEERFEGEGIGTGFSGGIDSFCTIYDHYVCENNPDYKINSLLFLNVGSHGFLDEAKVQKKFRARYQYLKQFPEETGLDFIPVDSNLYLFHPWGHQKTHTLTSVSGILFMQKLFSRYYYASAGLNYKDAISNADNYSDIDIGVYCDPIILPLLSTESIELISDGLQYDRVSKTVNIMDYEPVKRYLNVCVSGDDTHKNCSVCSKCCRTLMTLNSVGKLDDFIHVFNIDKYKSKAEKKYVCKQILRENKDPFAKGNVEFAKANNVKLPSYIYSFLILMPLLLKNKLIKIAKAILPDKVEAKIKALVKETK